MITQTLQDAVIEPLEFTSLPWKDTRRVFSLWDLMEYFEAHDVFTAKRELYAYELELYREVDELGNAHNRVEGSDASHAIEVLERVRKPFPAKEYAQVAATSSRLYSFITSGCTFEEMYIRVVALRESMEDELRGRSLVFVPGLNTKYYDNPKAFGEAVWTAFPHAEKDVREACNCYALDLGTACVFHLMRVLEKGLKVMADSLGIPSDHDCWGIILDRIEASIAKLKDERGTKERLADQQFYSEAAIEFRYFKDAWRNHVMHSSMHYEPEQALEILEHVRAFMQSLATKLSD